MDEGFPDIGSRQMVKFLFGPHRFEASYDFWSSHLEMSLHDLNRNVEGQNYRGKSSHSLYLHVQIAGWRYEGGFNNRHQVQSIRVESNRCIFFIQEIVHDFSHNVTQQSCIVGGPNPPHLDMLESITDYPCGGASFNR